LDGALVNRRSLDRLLTDIDSSSVAIQPNRSVVLSTIITIDRRQLIQVNTGKHGRR
jgi:hypothetical protein